MLGERLEDETPALISLGSEGASWENGAVQRQGKRMALRVGLLASCKIELLHGGT